MSDGGGAEHGARTSHNGQCYNPNCDEAVDWNAADHEAYCSWECAVDARSGGGSNGRA